MSYGGFAGEPGSSMPNSTTPDENAIYGVPSPTLVLLSKFAAVFTVIMMVLSFIFCLALGKSDGTDYLLATNIVISAVVGLTIAWWHKSGDLAGDKTWFLLLVCFVIVFQCLTTDIYVFHDRSPASTVAPITSTVHPVTTAATLLPLRRSLPM